MKIAFLVLCHKNPLQVNMLINQLLEFDSEIFIHVDKKNYSISNKINKNNRIHILSYDNCFDISWGGINMIKATLLLMEQAINSKKNFDYLWLLSGQDYLITSTKNIINFLNNNSEFNFIGRLEHDKKYFRHKKLYTISYPVWMTENKIINKVLKRLYMFITGGFSYTFGVFDRAKRYGIKIEVGSQWWTLTKDSSKYILDYCKKNPSYLEFYNKCLIPDESFFQTIIYNSEIKDKCKDKLTFVNWKNDNRSPENLTINDLNLLKEMSKKYFVARKFDIEEDKEIIDSINNVINKNR